MYKDNPNKWEEVSQKETIEKLKGYWKKDRIIPMLKNGEVLWTPYTEYKAIEINK